MASGISSVSGGSAEKLPKTVHVDREHTIFPAHPSPQHRIDLTTLDLLLVVVHYDQKGLLYEMPAHSLSTAVSLLEKSPSQVLTHFYPLARRLTTSPSDGAIYINYNDAGAVFIEASAGDVSVREISAADMTVAGVDHLFALNGAVCLEGHRLPLLAVQARELLLAIVSNYETVEAFLTRLLGHPCSARACPTTQKKTSIKERKRLNLLISASGSRFSQAVDWRRSRVGLTEISCAPLQISAQELKKCQRASPSTTIWLMEHATKIPLRNFVTCTASNGRRWLRISGLLQRQTHMTNIWISSLGIQSAFIPSPLRVKFFHFSKDMVTALKDRANLESPVPVSSLQALCAHVWQAVTRARKLDAQDSTTFQLSVDCRRRMVPPLPSSYFANFVQSVRVTTTAGEVACANVFVSAQLLQSVTHNHGDVSIRKTFEEFNRNPKPVLLESTGKDHENSVMLGSSPRFKMYETDFGWGRPLAPRSGPANKIDGKIQAYPGKEGDGSVDWEICLAPNVMDALEIDQHFLNPLLL